MSRKRVNNLHGRCAQDGSTLSPLPLRKIPRSAPSLPTTLPPSDAFVLVITRRVSCIPCVVSFASDLCVQSSFPLLVAQISDCLSTPFKTPLLHSMQPMDSTKSRLVSMGSHRLLMVKYTVFFSMCN